MERTLVLLRHSKSDWSQPEPDVSRPLNERGVRQSRQAGEWLAGADLGVDLALTSPALRTRATLQAVLDAGTPVGAHRVDEALYTGSGAEVVGVVAALDPAHGTVLLVSHEPALSEAVELLSGQPLRVRTSEIVVLTWDGAWNRGRGRAVVQAAGRPPGPVMG